jgi:hypothetical protein
LFLGIDGGLDGMLQRALKRFRSATVERKASNEKIGSLGGYDQLDYYRKAPDHTA